MSTTQTIAIARRFRGPNESGNGGYCCGVVAAPIAGPAEATLKRPPPLETPLALESDGQVAKLMHGDIEIGAARAIEPFDLDVPARPSLEAARAAAGRYRGAPYRECFVCGLDRAEGDGLCLHTGPVEASDIVADTWRPSADLAGPDGRVAAEYIWAALDCPSYFGLRRDSLFALLGRLSAQIFERPALGEELIVIGWNIGQDGRKYFGGSAVCAADGRVLAHAKAVWVELKPAQPGQV